MAYNGIFNDLKKCIDLKIPSRVPCFPLGLEFDIKNSGFTHQQYRDNPDNMVQVGLHVVKRYDYDWFLLHPDDLIEYESTGITVKYDDVVPPAVVNYLPPSVSTLKGLKNPLHATVSGRMALHLEGLHCLKRELGGSVCLTGRIAAPFSSVTLVLGVEPALMLMLENPKLFRKFLNFFIEYNDNFAQMQLEAGANAIWLGDCVASSHFISPEQYEEYAAEYADMSCKRIKKNGGIVFYHGSEKSIPHLKIMSSLSFDTINIGDGIDIGKAKDAIGNRKCIMGNLDTIHVLKPKLPEEVEKETKEIVRSAMVRGGYIFCTGEGISRDTPEENVRAMVKAAKLYGKY
jgi:uroporphyrinogen decarboxylase